MPDSLQLKKIQKHKLGLRSGTDLKGAAYALADFGDDLNANGAEFKRFLHIMNPVRGGDWERKWCARYMATVELIRTMRSSGSVLLVSHAPPTAERYGDGTEETFAKCNRLCPDAKILAKVDYTKDETRNEIMKRITAAIDGLDDPGNNFL